MITFLITLLCVSILFMISVLNYWRIERMAHNQREFTEQARKEINALNTILLIRFKNKQRMEQRLLLKIVERIERIEESFIMNDFELRVDVNDLRSTLNTMLNDDKILYDYSETQARLKILGEDEAANDELEHSA